jgi:hypothetical protein
MYPVVILVALSGFGCQNPELGELEALPSIPPPSMPIAASAPDDWRMISVAGMPPAGKVYGGGQSGGYPGGNALRSTLISFVLGHDDDVRSSAEIEGEFYSRYGASPFFSVKK